MFTSSSLRRRKGYPPSSTAEPKRAVSRTGFPIGNHILINKLDQLEMDHRYWIDPTQQGLIKDDRTGDCVEGQHFEKIKLIKKATDADKNEVWLVKGIDAAQSTEHVVKEIQRTEFRKNEVLAQKELQFDCDFFARLFIVRRHNDKICLHFTLVPDGEPVSDVCARLKRWMDKVETGTNESLLVRQFAVCFLHRMLEVLQHIQMKGWTHGDLTSGNIMFSKLSFTITVIDFGQAEKLCASNATQDLHTVLVRFTELYTAGNFGDMNKLLDTLKGRVEGNEIASCKDIPAEEKQATIQLLEYCRNITTAGCAGVLDPSNALRQVAKVLFPGLRKELSGRAPVTEELQESVRKIRREVIIKLFEILYSVQGETSESSSMAETPGKDISALQVHVARSDSHVPPQPSVDQLMTVPSQPPPPPPAWLDARSAHGTPRGPQGLADGKPPQQPGEQGAGEPEEKSEVTPERGGQQRRVAWTGNQEATSEGLLGMRDITNARRDSDSK